MIDVEIAEQQHAATIEQVLQDPTRSWIERHLRAEAADLRAERRGEIPDFQVSHRSLPLQLGAHFDHSPQRPVMWSKPRSTAFARSPRQPPAIQPSTAEARTLSTTLAAR